MPSLSPRDRPPRMPARFPDRPRVAPGRCLMITSICPGCKTRRELSVEAAGSTFLCPCGTEVVVPHAAPPSTSTTDLRPGARWYYERNGTPTGPISEPELRRLAANWELAAGDRVWSGGMADWQPAASVLTGAFADAAPPAEPGWSPLWGIAVVLMTLALASVILLAMVAIRGAPPPPATARVSAT